MRRRPVYMAADDHEFRDDHNNAVRRRHRREWLAARDAMWRYQYAAGPRGVAGALRHNGKYGYSMQTAGFDTFVCDTRNRRLEQSEVHSTTRRIMLDEQFTAIERWLAQSKQTGRARFLVVPTPVAPVFRTAVSRPEYGLRCDDWQRYPESLAKLFALLVADGAERLVLLSGDYHCFVDCELEIFGNGAVSGEPVRCRSIVTSGAHSPYGFANTDEEELWQPSGSGVKLTCGPYRWSYHIHRFAAGRGYTLIEAHGATLADPIFVKLP